jgi:hypothetical protein
VLSGGLRVRLLRLTVVLCLSLLMRRLTVTSSASVLSSIPTAAHLLLLLNALLHRNLTLQLLLKVEVALHLLKVDELVVLELGPGGGEGSVVVGL